MLPATCLEFIISTKTWQLQDSGRATDPCLTLSDPAKAATANDLQVNQCQHRAMAPKPAKQ